MNRKISYPLYLFMVIMVMPGIIAQAAAIDVTTTLDNVPGSLREAITRANTNNEDDTINLPAGTYFLSGAAGDDANISGDLDIDNTGSITIIGEGSRNTIIDGNKIDRVLHILGGTVSISGVTIQRGKTPDGTSENLNGGSGGGVYNNGTLTLSNCNISNNATGSGHDGYIYYLIYSDSGSGGNGGGICNTGALTLTDCTISNNFTGNSGGGYPGYAHGESGHGGGIYNSGTQNLSNCTVRNNTTNTTGSGIYSPGDGGDGGGVYNSGTQHLTGCSIINNITGSGSGGTSGSGGGIYNTGDQESTLTNCIIKNNTLSIEEYYGNTGNGGGICNYSILTLTDCDISSNKTYSTSGMGYSGKGGGIFSSNETDSSAGITLTNCTISNNATAGGKKSYYYSSSGDGGGIYNSSTIKLTNCTISSNRTGNGTYDEDGGNGGGIHHCEEIYPGPLTLISCTICNNATGEGGSRANGGSGGGIYKKNGTITIKNTIIANNQVAEGGDAPDCSGAINSQGYNLIEDTGGCTLTGDITGNITGVDPMLDSLAYNGGITLNHALLPGSPAIDAGCRFGTSTDQRGCARPVDIPGIPNANDGSDIGSYEYSSQYFISGRVTVNGYGLPGVTLTFSNEGDTTTKITDANGNYSYAVSSGWSGMVTPSKPTYSFTPSSRNYISVKNSQTNQDYTAVSTVPSQISLNRTQLYFGADTAGHRTGPQTILIANSGGGTLNWTIDTNANWLNCTPTSGSNSSGITVSVDPPGLTPGFYYGTITVEDHNASNSPQNVTVTLNVYDPGSSQAPFGSFDTPLHGSTVRSSIPVTGWVIDDICVENVKIYRNPVTGEGSAQVYIGDAVLVEGARPDIEALYPDYPMNYKAGWGYMMLTNSLPNQGNGTFTIHAKAADKEGNIVILGTKTIICDNINAVKPFGAIDTPAQGGTVSGSNFVNFGWALTPLPNNIPTDGSTITVWVDGLPLGHPVYNQYRADIAALFPGYNNSNGAVGYYYLDTTRYENGVHTIQWTVTDDAGNTDGIGSRFFTIQNAGESSRQSVVNSHWSMEKMKPSPIPLDNSEPVRIKKGYDNTDSQIAYPDNNGCITIEIKELERLEIHLFEPGESTLKITPLPIGSTVDSERGVFYWQPGPGFVGEYQFVFVIQSYDSEVEIRKIMIRVHPLFDGKGENNE